jgi:hypothetical protein
MRLLVSVVVGCFAVCATAAASPSEIHSETLALCSQSRHSARDDAHAPAAGRSGCDRDVAADLQDDDRLLWLASHRGTNFVRSGSLAVCGLARRALCWSVPEPTAKLSSAANDVLRI